ncbi:hypothetical protein [Tsukamurella paurometabola]|nr:hypothetical protein [Tsukamurella paurometabola]UEA85159.1 hypothetical protein LK411_10245 [Tsukamurella paurometabola]
MGLDPRPIPEVQHDALTAARDEILTDKASGKLALPVPARQGVAVGEPRR